MKGIFESFCEEVKASFKVKDQTPGHLNAKKEELEVESHIANTDKKKTKNLYESNSLTNSG